MQNGSLVFTGFLTVGLLWVSGTGCSQDAPNEREPVTDSSTDAPSDTDQQRDATDTTDLAVDGISLDTDAPLSDLPHDLYDANASDLSEDSSDDPDTSGSSDAPEDPGVAVDADEDSPADLDAAVDPHDADATHLDLVELDTGCPAEPPEVAWTSPEAEESIACCADLDVVVGFSEPMDPTSLDDEIVFCTSETWEPDSDSCAISLASVTWDDEYTQAMVSIEPSELTGGHLGTGAPMWCDRDGCSLSLFVDIDDPSSHPRDACGDAMADPFSMSFSITADPNWTCSADSDCDGSPYGSLCEIGECVECLLWGGACNALRACCDSLMCNVLEGACCATVGGPCRGHADCCVPLSCTGPPRRATDRPGHSLYFLKTSSGLTSSRFPRWHGRRLQYESWSARRIVRCLAST